RSERGDRRKDREIERQQRDGGPAEDRGHLGLMGKRLGDPVVREGEVRDAEQPGEEGGCLRIARFRDQRGKRAHRGQGERPQSERFETGSREQAENQRRQARVFYGMLPEVSRRERYPRHGASVARRASACKRQLTASSASSPPSSLRGRRRRVDARRGASSSRAIEGGRMPASIAPFSSASAAGSAPLVGRLRLRDREPRPRVSRVKGLSSASATSTSSPSMARSPSSGGASSRVSRRAGRSRPRSASSTSSTSSSNDCSRSLSRSCSRRGRCSSFCARMSAITRK